MLMTQRIIKWRESRATANTWVLLKEYSVEIYEWSGASWEPYNANDVQVQFYMMSPYVLKTLSADHKVFLSDS